MKKPIIVCYIFAAFAFVCSILNAFIARDPYAALTQLTICILVITIARLMKILDKYRDDFDRLIFALDRAYQKIARLERQANNKED